MFNQSIIYKIELMSGNIKIFYTGQVISEDEIFIEILTVHPFNETIIVNKHFIVQCKIENSSNDGVYLHDDWNSRWLFFSDTYIICNLFLV